MGTMIAAYPIEAHGHNFKRKKEQFLLATDTYRFWTMMSVEKGSFRFGIDGCSGVATRGYCVICPPHMEFRREVIQPVDLHFMLFSWTQNASTHEHEQFVKDTSYLIKPSDANRLQSSLSTLKRLGQRTAKHQLRTHYMYDIWLQLNEEINSFRVAPPVPDKLIDRAKALLVERALEPLQLKDIAAELHLSRVELTRRFTARFGMTPKEHLTGIRMDRARSLLSETNLTIDHIAQLCGYTNGFYFSRIFSKLHGITPSEYRKTYST
jgi:AraC family transcriptional regulator